MEETRRAYLIRLIALQASSLAVLGIGTLILLSPETPYNYNAPGDHATVWKVQQTSSLAKLFICLNYSKTIPGGPAYVYWRQLHFHAVHFTVIYITFPSPAFHYFYEPVVQARNSMRKTAAKTRLTTESLQKLKALGFSYMLVKGYSPDWKGDHVGLNYLTMIAVRELPQGEGEKEIYDSIDSRIFEDWAAEPEDGICAFIEGDPFSEK